MLDVEGGAQQDRFPAGTQQIALRMAERLGDRVRVGEIVQRIERDPDGATVHTGAGRYRARAVVVAVAPALRADIAFEPALPDGYAALAEHWPQGNLSKAYAAYETPFWRADGRSGEALSDDGPVFITFDVSPAESGSDGTPGILLGFTDARTFDPLPPEERRARALDCFANLFGEDARHPIDYVDHSWGAETFAPGGPTAAVPPGSWTAHGQWLRRPVAGIFWAGTETADQWTGFLDGAVRSGRRAAGEVADYLTPAG
jgi:monoamine oxidase